MTCLAWSCEQAPYEVDSAPNFLQVELKNLSLKERGFERDGFTLGLASSVHHHCRTWEQLKLSWGELIVPGIVFRRMAGILTR